MQTFDIIKHNEIKKKSFRVAQLYDQFDLQANQFDEHFEGNINLPDVWNIGVIYGKSGTGKTTIAKELFGNYFCNFKYSADSVVDDFDKSIKSDLLFSVLSSVGFSSPPSWLKPYSVLSNGEKMRVDLARAILQEQEIIVFDEYTSVVDREIAKIGSLALQKSIRKQNKKFIAVTCHNDVLDWINPDWTFCTDDMTYHDTRGLLRHPEIKLEVRKVRGYWTIFRRYHYLNSDLSKASAQYIAFYNNNPVAFCAVINFPHPKIRPMWKIHRIVVLPDYQGIGIGKKLLNFIAGKYYPDYIGITTSLNGFAKSLMHDKDWILIHTGKVSAHKNIESFQKSSSSDRNTYSFRYFPKGEFSGNV